ncbi:MAG TPA: phage recombination protein Bet [Burkholderiales bacterium]|nr:phage recombination protein Bet [Burkholderiales bacterium]
MSKLVVSQAAALAKSLSLAPSDTAELVAALKATAFKGQVSDAQMTALLVVANQYGLNPWTKEIYAFPDRQNGIVPVVGVDGWSRIINSHPQFDGMDFDQDDERCTCIIYRKDRTHPIRVTEYMAECKRDGVGPWKSHPRRMLRHKAMIQCARIAFGFVGIYEQDEAEHILEAQVSEIPADRPANPAPYPAESFEKNLPRWRELIESGSKTADEIIALVSSKGRLTAEQIKAIRDCEEVRDAEVVEPEQEAREAEA